MRTPRVLWRRRVQRHRGCAAPASRGSRRQVCPGPQEFCARRAARRPSSLLSQTENPKSVSASLLFKLQRTNSCSEVLVVRRPFRQRQTFRTKRAFLALVQRGALTTQVCCILRHYLESWLWGSTPSRAWQVENRRGLISRPLFSQCQVSAARLRRTRRGVGLLRPSPTWHLTPRGRPAARGSGVWIRGSLPRSSAAATARRPSGALFLPAASTARQRRPHRGAASLRATHVRRWDAGVDPSPAHGLPRRRPERLQRNVCVSNYSFEGTNAFAVLGPAPGHCEVRHGQRRRSGGRCGGWDGRGRRQGEKRQYAQQRQVFGEQRGKKGIH